MMRVFLPYHGPPSAAAKSSARRYQLRCLCSIAFFTSTVTTAQPDHTLRRLWLAGCSDSDQWRYRQAESPGADISKPFTRNLVGLRHTASELNGLEAGFVSSFFRRVVTKKSQFGSVKFPLPSPAVALAKRTNQNVKILAAPPVLGLSDNQIRAPSDFFSFFQTSSILLTCVWKSVSYRAACVRPYQRLRACLRAMTVRLALITLITTRESGVLSGPPSVAQTHRTFGRSKTDISKTQRHD